ncbi:MAG: DUF402 domain-containing protein [Streptococcaceae bacterium]|jgi:protein associated with RNAse G/E|nr:DUF402 domain-containing protein [Streptococcaceae bacterium]
MNNVPKEGEVVTIQSFKHNGQLHRVWRDTLVLKTSEYSIIGVNDHTLVTESDGRKWVTREPAIVYFHKKFWFNIIAMIRDNGISYYCNLASPFLVDSEALKYIDYDLDIKVFPDGEKKLLDVEEYEFHKRKMRYSKEIDFILKENVKLLVEWINQKKGPFSPEYVKIWAKRYDELTGKNVSDSLKAD